MSGKNKVLEWPSENPRLNLSGILKKMLCQPDWFEEESDFHIFNWRNGNLLDSYPRVFFPPSHYTFVFQFNLTGQISHYFWQKLWNYASRSSVLQTLWRASIDNGNILWVMVMHSCAAASHWCYKSKAVYYLFLCIFQWGHKWLGTWTCWRFEIESLIKPSTDRHDSSRLLFEKINLYCVQRMFI